MGKNARNREGEFKQEWKQAFHREGWIKAQRRTELGVKRGYHSSINICQPEIPARMPESQLLVIEAHGMKQGGMEIVHMHLVCYGVMAKFIRFSKGVTCFKTAASQPDGESRRIVIAPGAIIFCKFNLPGNLQKTIYQVIFCSKCAVVSFPLTCPALCYAHPVLPAAQLGLWGLRLSSSLLLRA